tara:strand:- start:98 stop:445 length:348 start_codon:yes stop_codon:yes gene_type:complete
MSRMNLVRPIGIGKLSELKEALQSVPVEIATAITSHGPRTAKTLTSRLQSTFPRLAGRLVVTFQEETSSYSITILGSGAMESISSEVQQIAIGEIVKLNEEIGENITELITRSMR